MIKKHPQRRTHKANKQKHRITRKRGGNIFKKTKKTLTSIYNRIRGRPTPIFISLQNTTNIPNPILRGKRSEESVVLSKNNTPTPNKNTSKYLSGWVDLDKLDWREFVKINHPDVLNVLKENPSFISPDTIRIIEKIDYLNKIKNENDKKTKTLNELLNLIKERYDKQEKERKEKEAKQEHKKNSFGSFGISRVSSKNSADGSVFLSKSSFLEDDIPIEAREWALITSNTSERAYDFLKKILPKKISEDEKIFEYIQKIPIQEFITGHIGLRTKTIILIYHKGNEFKKVTVILDQEKDKTHYENLKNKTPEEYFEYLTNNKLIKDIPDKNFEILKPIQLVKRIEHTIPIGPIDCDFLFDTNIEILDSKNKKPYLDFDRSELKGCILFELLSNKNPKIFSLIANYFENPTEYFKDQLTEAENALDHYDKEFSDRGGYGYLLRVFNNPNIFNDDGHLKKFIKKWFDKFILYGKYDISELEKELEDPKFNEYNEGFGESDDELNDEEDKVSDEVYKYFEEINGKISLRYKYDEMVKYLYKNPSKHIFKFLIKNGIDIDWKIMSGNEALFKRDLYEVLRDRCEALMNLFIEKEHQYNYPPIMERMLEIADPNNKDYEKYGINEEKKKEIQELSPDELIEFFKKNEISLLNPTDIEKIKKQFKNDENAIGTFNNNTGCFFKETPEYTQSEQTKFNKTRKYKSKSSLKSR